MPNWWTGKRQKNSDFIGPFLGLGSKTSGLILEPCLAWKYVATAISKGTDVPEVSWWHVLHMYVCMYVCMYVSIYVYLSVCIYVCLSVSMSVCLYLCLSVCLSVCMYVCMYMYNNICMLYKVTITLTINASTEPLVHCRNVTKWSLFCRYCFGRCSFYLVELVSLPYSRERLTHCFKMLLKFSNHHS